MTKGLRVEYNKNVCIGHGNCAAISPDQFELLGKKATLINSKDIDNGIYAIELDYDKNTKKNLIEGGKSCPVNAIRVIDSEKNVDLVNVKVEEDGAKELKDKYDDANEFVLDDAGYFLIRINREHMKIETAFCNEKNKIILKVARDKPIDIYQTIINKEKLPIRKDHCAYLGRELQKAYLALKNNLEYIQDEDLDLTKKVKQ